MKTKAIDILARAREFLSDKSRWIKGDMWTGDIMCPTGACALGAVYVAAGKEGRSWNADLGSPYNAACAALIRGIQATSNTIVAGIPSWNDTRSRKHQEVLAAFDKAIVLEQTRGS